MHEAIEFVVRVRERFSAVARRPRLEKILGSTSQPRHVPRKLVPVDRFAYTGLKSLGNRHHPIECFVVEYAFERGAHRRERQRIARKGSPDAARVAVFLMYVRRDAVADVPREAVRRGRNAARYRLSDDEKVRLEPV